MELTQQNVEDLFKKCMGPGRVFHGMYTEYTLNPFTVKIQWDNIQSLLDELPEDFKDGQSITRGMRDKEGKQWTGSHKVVELLMILGFAVDRVQYCIDREYWSALPNGLPMYFVKDRYDYLR